MIINKYGVKLCRLQEEDLELVRNKRNSLPVRRNMFFQKTITSEMQKK
jgi:hypothetical protein